MFGALLRAILVVIVVVAAVAFFMGYRTADPPERPVEERPIVGMTGRLEEGLDRAGEVGGRAIEQARDAASEASLAAKIKSKMALDDFVQARHITVRAENDVVTLEGTVRSEAERRRAVRLARETEGVRTVHDRLQVVGNERAAGRRSPQ